MSDGLKLLSVVAETASISSLRGLDRSLFIDEEIPVYEYLRRHYRRYRELPSVQTLEEECGIELPQAPEAYDYYLDRVNDRKFYTQIRPEYNQLKEDLRRFDMPAVRGTVDRMRAVSRVNNSESTLMTLGDAVHSALGEYDYAKDNPGLSGVPTGWDYLDLQTGGYQPGDLISWVARPEVGKTFTLLKQVTSAYLAGFSILLVTTEMPVPQLARRQLALLCGIDPSFIKKGTLSTYTERAVRSYADSLASSRRMHVFAAGMKKTTADVDILIGELMPDIVYIDGIYLLRPENPKITNRTERVSEVFDEAKSMTITHKRPIVCTTQFNRTSGKKGKDGSLENIAYSDAISTHSSVILSIQEADSGVGEDARKAVLLKGREGEAGYFHYRYRFRPPNFDEIPAEEIALSAGEGVDLDWVD